MHAPLVVPSLRGTRLGRWLGSIALAFFSGLTGAAATPVTSASPADASLSHLQRLSFTELMAMEVTSVSRKAESFSRAASAISVLTSDDIRRSGATTIADALRFSTGLEVARIDGHTWGVASRGFNASASNKLLVLQDGRSLYTPLFSGVFWDVQDTELSDLDRIEVVRGPGATLWGANAVNGVISIQTKNARETQGTSISGGAGNEERHFASARHGWKLGAGAYARVYVKHYNRDDLVNPAGVDTNDDAQMWQGGFRADGEPSRAPGAWTVQGDYYHGFLGNLDRVASRVAGGNLLGRWRQALTPNHTWVTQAYYDRVERLAPGQFRETRNSFDFDTQLDAVVGAHQHVVVGLVARTSQDRTDPTGAIRFSPANRRISVLSALVQDEISFADGRAGLTLGARFERNSSTGFEVQPSVRAAWHPRTGQTLWAALSRAVRTPSRFDDDLRIVSTTGIFARGDPNFRSEELFAHELGYRVQPHRRWAMDFTAFMNRYDRLRSQEPSTEPGIRFVLGNQLNAESHGGEVLVHGEITTKWRVRAMYARLHRSPHFDAGSADNTRGVQEGNDPKHIFTFVSNWNLARTLEFDALLRHTSALPSPTVPAYAQVDLRLGWRPSARWELSLLGQNVNDPRHREFGPRAGPTARAIERSYYAKITCHF